MIIIARAREQKIINTAIAEKKNLFVYGESGTGKTCLVRQAVENSGGTNILYAADCSTPKNTLLGLLAKQADNAAWKQKSVRELKSLVYRMLERKKYYLIFDHVGKAGPKFFSFFESLIETYPMLIVARAPYIGEIGRLALLLGYFAQLEIAPFNRRETFALIGHFIRKFRLKPGDREYFKKEIFRTSCGNPAVIEDICRYAQEDKYRVGGRINFKLLNLDREMSFLV